MTRLLNIDKDYKNTDNGYTKSSNFLGYLNNPPTGSLGFAETNQSVSLGEGESDLRITRLSTINRLNDDNAPVDLSRVVINWSNESRQFYRDLCIAWAVDKDSVIDSSRSVYKDIRTTRKTLSIKKINNNRIVITSVLPNATANATACYHEDSDSEDNAFRSKKSLTDLILANSDIFCYFFTFTIDSTKLDREDGKTAQQKISRLLRRLGIKYIYIAEMHSDGKSWHFHGVADKGIEPYLVEFYRQDYYPYTDKLIPLNIIKELDRGNKVYDMPEYSKRFGYCTVSPIKSQTACAFYIRKYMTKESYRLGRRRYFASKGLRRPEYISAECFDIADFELDSYTGLNEHTCQITLNRKVPISLDAKISPVRPDITRTLHELNYSQLTLFNDSP